MTQIFIETTDFCFCIVDKRAIVDLVQNKTERMATVQGLGSETRMIKADPVSVTLMQIG